MNTLSFIGFFIFLVLVVLFFIFGMYSQIAFVLFVIILVVGGIIFFLAVSLRKYNQFQRAIIFRFGKFNRIGGPGWTIVLPFIEEVYEVVDVRTKMQDFTISAFTSDDIKLTISGTLFYRIADPERATLNITDYQEGITTLITSGVRNTIRSLSMRDVFGELDKLNDMVFDACQTLAEKWGIGIESVQIKTVAPPEEVIQAMQQPEIAANLLQAQKFKADARKIVLEALGEGAKSLDDRAVMYLYLEALRQIGESSSSKIVLPMQFFSGGEGGAEGALLGLSAAAIASLGGQQNVQNAIEAIKKKITQQ